jgi:hypothetical protein
MRATKASPASTLSWFRRGNAVSADDDGAARNDDGAVRNEDAAVPDDDDAVRSDDRVLRWHGGVVRRNGRAPASLPGPVMRPDTGTATGGRAGGSFAGWPAGPAAATETGGPGFLERIESGALADGPGERIAFEGGDQDVAAEGHFGVFGLAGQLLQAAETRVQQIVDGEIVLRFGQVVTGRDELRILAEQQHRLAAQRFGALAHFGEAAALCDRQFDQRGEPGFQGGDGGVDDGDVFGRKVQGYEVLAHGGVSWGWTGNTRTQEKASRRQPAVSPPWSIRAAVGTAGAEDLDVLHGISLPGVNGCPARPGGHNSQLKT